jgi:plasmid stabilization system protein ParE
VIEVGPTRPAAIDLQNIARRIRRDNPRARGAVAKTLYDGCMGLNILPNRRRAGRIPGTRAYQVTSDLDEILRIYHGAQDWP